MASTTELTVRYAETDAMGVVHHATYPIWFEIARTDYIKHIGLSYTQMERNGVMLPVAGLTVKYRQPAKYDDELIITARVTRLTPARVEFAYTASRKKDGELLTEGTSTHAFVDTETFKPINLMTKMPEFFEIFSKEAEKDMIS